MAQITGWRPRGTDTIYVCEKCGIVVPPDRDGCPNGPGIAAEFQDPDTRHHLTRWVSANKADEELRAAQFDHKVAAIGVSAIEAAEASLEVAKAALRG